jgi:hypothetical protein
LTNVLTRLARLEQQYAAPLPPPAYLTPLQLAARAGLVPDAWQRRALTSTAPRQLWNVARQLGKSSIAAVLAVHVAVYAPGAPVLILSPSQRQSVETFRKVTETYTALARPVPVEAESTLRLELENGSRVIALPGKEATVRGLSGVRLLILDEASRVSDELYVAVRPMLAVSGGRLLVMSTPFGRRGFFFREWTEGQAWERMEVHADACPRISPAFLAEERAALGKHLYAQEYECAFLATEAEAFDWASVERAIRADVAPLWAPDPTGRLPLRLPAS